MIYDAVTISDNLTVRFPTERPITGILKHRFIHIPSLAP